MKLTFRFYFGCLLGFIGIKLVDGNAVNIDVAYGLVILGLIFMLLECIMQMRIEKNKIDRQMQREYEKYLRDYRGY